MKTNEQVRIETKLKLWETPGFFQFIEDLAEYHGSESNLKLNVESVKRNYLYRLKELEKDNKFKQGKLPL